MNYKAESFIKNVEIINGTFLGINKLPIFPETISDEEYIITPEFNERPDLLANKLYGSPKLYWVFALRNLDILLDPIRDFKAGTLIMLPSKDSVDKIAKSI